MKNLKELRKRLIGKGGKIMDLKDIKTELFNDNFQNYKRYGIPRAGTIKTAKVNLQEKQLLIPILISICMSIFIFAANC